MTNSANFNSETLRRARIFAHLMAMIAFAGGSLVLIGWQTHIDWLKTILPGAVSMKPVTAVCFIAISISLLSLVRSSSLRGGRILVRAGIFCGWLVAFISIATLIEYRFELDFGLDSLLFPQQLLVLRPNGPRMAEATALGFAALAFSFLLPHKAQGFTRHTKDSLALLAASLGLVALVGYIYDVKALYNFYLYSSMALHTSLLLLGVGLGLLFAQPDRGMTAVVTSRSSGGLMARRILAIAVLLPLVMGWFRLKGEQIGLYESAFGLGLFAVGNIFTFVGLVWLAARAVNQVDEDRHQASELLRVSEERLRLLIDSVSEYAIFMLDTEGRVVTWNSGAQKFKGYQAKEIIGKSFSCFYPEEDRSAGKPQRELEEAVANGVCHDESWRIRKDGTRFWANVTITALKNTGGQLVGFAKVTRDLTEPRAAERALRESEQRFRLMADSAPVMLWVSGPDKLCTFFNKTWLDFTGRTMDEEMGNGWAEGVHPDDKVRCVQLYSNSFDARVPFTMEYRLRRHDGEYRWLADDGIPRFDSGGTFVGYIGSCVDITERKRATEERLRLLNVLEASLNEVYIFDAESLRFDYVNRGAQRNLGYSLAELQQLTPVDLKPEYTDTSFRAAINPLLKSEREKLIFYTVHRRKDGSDYPVEVHLQLVDQGERKVFLAVILDISDRRQAEAELREGELRLTGLVDSAMDGIITIDSEQRIVLFNPAAESMFGVTAKEVMGGSIERLLPEQFRASHSHNIRIFGETGCSSRRMGALGSISGRRADGSEFPMEASISQVKIQGKPFYTVILRDITERTRAEKALRESEAKFSTLFNKASLPVVVSRFPDHEFVDVNEAWTELFEIEKSHAIGKTSLELGVNRNGKTRRTVTETVSKRQAVRNYEQELFSNSGQPLTVLTNVNVLSIGGEDYALTTMQDITERKKAEGALREAKENLELKVIERTAELASAKERAELADAHKTAFLATMSHELRTPMNAIVGFTGMLLLKLPGPLNAAQEDHLTTVQSSAKHLLSLINDLLDLAKVEAGRLSLNKQSVDCQEVISEVAATLQPLAQQKGLELSVILPDEALTLYTDQRVLSQILINLTNNAIKFTAQGKVEVALSSRCPNGGPPVTCIEVADTGIGIRAEDQKELFEAFKQVGHDHRFEGTGLGLHLSQKLAGELNGRIELESEYGVGSRFRLLIPDGFERSN